MQNVNRRKFVKTFSAAAASAALAAAGCKTKKENSHSTYSGEIFEWKMVTTWAPHFPILGESADLLAKRIEEMSGGRLKIQVYGGGELVPPFESFDAVSQGVAELGHGASYYWAGKMPAAQFFSGIPFGMNNDQMNAWLYFGGGLQLWEETYEKFNLIPMPVANTGGQMGGWFNKEINSIADFKGLKMRIPGLGGRVVTKAGGTTVLSPGAELYTNLERGVIDALEWIGPYHDYLMGFHKIAKYYYYPGWHEPNGCIELIVNKSAFEKLPKELQTIIRVAAQSSNVLSMSEFFKKNQEHLLMIKDEKKVEIREFTSEVINELKKLSKQVIEEIISGDKQSKKVFESYSKFQKEISVWSGMTEKNYEG